MSTIRINHEVVQARREAEDRAQAERRALDEAAMSLDLSSLAATVYPSGFRYGVAHVEDGNGEVFIAVVRERQYRRQFHRMTVPRQVGYDRCQWGPMDKWEDLPNKADRHSTEIAARRVIVSLLKQEDQRQEQVEVRARRNALTVFHCTLDDSAPEARP